MKNTLNFIQKVMLGLGQSKLPPKLQSLKKSPDELECNRNQMSDVWQLICLLKWK